MDTQALELLKSLHTELKKQELREERLIAKMEAQAQEQELIRAQERKEQELREARIIQKMEAQHKELKEQLTRIENHVLVIRGNVVPIDLDGITPETKDELQELCTEAYDQFVDTPNEFDPRLLTPYDPRVGIIASVTPKYSISTMKKKGDLIRAAFVLSESEKTHSKKVIFGDYTSKFSKALWGYNFDGWYPESILLVLDKLQYYFFQERSNSRLVQNGRWT